MLTVPSPEEWRVSLDRPHPLWPPTSVRCCSSIFTFFSAAPKAPSSEILPAVTQAWGETQRSLQQSLEELLCHSLSAFTQGPSPGSPTLLIHSPARTPPHIPAMTEPALQGLSRSLFLLPCLPALRSLPTATYSPAQTLSLRHCHLPSPFLPQHTSTKRLLTWKARVITFYKMFT